jgi:hypothetical protein
MQAAILRVRAGCSESDQKEWVRKGVLIPAVPGSGPGVHAVFDEANVLTAAIAMHMKQAHITVAKYAGAFSQLQVWLRERSALEWSRYLAILTPEAATLVRLGEDLPGESIGFLVDIGAVYRTIPGADTAALAGQMPLPFGISAVS